MAVAASFAFLSLFFPVAASASPEQDFAEAVRLFEQEDYARAVQLFRRAEQQSLQSPALYYNLASSYYKLGDYPQAEKYFLKVREYERLRVLGEYNLGLVALKQDMPAVARSWFAAVLEGGDAKLRALAKDRLATLPAENTKTVSSRQPDNKKTDRPRQRWSLYLTLDGGYDSNVNFAPLGIRSSRSDSFSEFISSVDYLFAGNRRNGWLAELSFYDINYRRESVFDQYEYSVSLKKYWRISPRWQSRFSLLATKTNYGNEAYQSIYKLGAQARYTLDRDSYLFLRYVYDDINSDNSKFDYLEGWRQRLRVEYRLYRKQDSSRIYYELELNDREDIHPGFPPPSTGYFSYSPMRHQLRGKYTWIFSRAWRLNGDLSYRYSDYPKTISLDRQDRRIKAKLYLQYRANKYLKIRAKAEHSDNRSSEAVYTYKRNVYSLGLSLLF